MKNRALLVRFVGLVILCAAMAAAQDNVTVPLSDPSGPATVRAHLITGTITVTVGSGPQVVVMDSSRRGRPQKTPSNIPQGMHRIDPGNRRLTVEEDHNVVTISGGGWGGENLVLQVPVNTSVDLSTVNGRIDVTGLNGELDVKTTNSSIELKDVSGAVSASTTNGSVVVGLNRVTPDKPMSFSSFNGKVDVTLPADTKARLRLKTTNGSIYSDFDVKMEPDTTKPVIEDSRGQGGKYVIRMDRGAGIYGSINGGGPEYSFQTFNGTILIHKK